jgi:hypothetical protein
LLLIFNQKQFSKSIMYLFQMNCYNYLPTHISVIRFYMSTGSFISSNFCILPLSFFKEFILIYLIFLWKVIIVIIIKVRTIRVTMCVLSSSIHRNYVYKLYPWLNFFTSYSLSLFQNCEKIVLIYIKMFELKYL